MRRVVILGGPRVGKTTLSDRLKDELQIWTVRHSDDIKHLGWSESSAEASKWFNESGEWICEGVQMARALRKWLLANPNTPLDADVITLNRPFETLLKGQDSMTKGVWTVFREIEAELRQRGARIHNLVNPNDAITIIGQRPKTMLTTSYKTQEEIPENQRGAYVQSGNEWVLDTLANDHPIVVKRDELLSENTAQKTRITKLTNEKDALSGTSLPAGHVALPEADAQIIEKVKPFGSVTEVVTKLTEHKTLKEESETRQRDDHLRKVAKALNYEPNAFVLLQNLPEFEIRGEGEAQTVVAKVKGNNNVVTEKPASEFMESSAQYAPLMPALKAQPLGVHVHGSVGNSGSPIGADDPIAKRNQAREEARKAAPNPLMARPALPGAAVAVK
jgi:hypothetical protein